MDVRVLGPIEAGEAGQPIDLGAPKQRLVFCVLVCHAGRPVSTDRLVDALWDGKPPASARDNVQQHVHRLRRSLGTQRLVSHGRLGYTLEVERHELDLFRFTDLLAGGREAMAAGEWVRSSRLLRDALAQWRGEPFADLVEEPALVSEVSRLRELRLTALEYRMDTDLALGDHEHIVVELRELIERHPYRERFHEQLMLSLLRSGRQAAALEAYQEARRILAEELGLEPDARLRRLEAAILSGSPIQVAAPADGARVVPAPADGARVVPAPADGARVVPAQLPARSATFTGRSGELAQLDAFAAPGRPVVAAIAGTAGMGKTALAVHWGHLAAQRFPDGQLYVNMRGFAPGGSVLTPAEAVRGFLDALGVPPERIPSNVDMQYGLYRSLLSGKRILVVLDNARTAEQVRPLLPGSAGCMAVVTSRYRLTGLVALDGALPLDLEMLPEVDARQILALRLGEARVGAESAAVEQIMRLCAGLPLALVIIAARAAVHPKLPLAHIVSELRDARHSLDIFAQDDPTADLRSVFDWSYQNLSRPAARLFRLLGLHCGPDISVAAAASLAGVEVRDVRRLLAELTEANVITEFTAGRYGQHDLLRAYAAEQASGYEAPDEQAAALRRVFDHYLHSGAAASRTRNPHRLPIELQPLSEAVFPETFESGEQTVTWFASEHRVLVAAVHQAARSGFDAHAWQLAWVLADYLQRSGHWRDQAVTQHAALDAARRISSLAGQASAYGNLARAYARSEDTGKARHYFERAFELQREIGDPAAQAHTQLGLGALAIDEGRHEDALQSASLASELFREAGDHMGQQRALNSLGWCYAQIGNFELALEVCQQALAILRGSGLLESQGHAWDSVGYAQHHLGDFESARESYGQALVMFRRMGAAHAEAETLWHLGDTQQALGDLAAAKDSYRRSLEIFEGLGHDKAAAVRASLNALSPKA